MPKLPERQPDYVTREVREGKVYRFKLFGLEFPVTRAAVWALSLVAVLGAAGFTWQMLSDPERVILSLKDVNARLAGEVEEYGLHVMEEPTKHELFADSDGQLSLRVYADHCVLIQRRTSRGIRTKLVPDLARTDFKAVRMIAPPLSLLPVVHAAGQNACNRGCLNPHPGGFRWWYGERRGEWVEVWRQWPEGCTHVQLFNPRVGAWDTNNDGTPRVKWTCCVH